MSKFATSLLLLLLPWLTACGEKPWNNPHPPGSAGENVYQTMMASTPPKHLDPAISYAADESVFLMQIYDPPMAYHFLKRPYELIPGSLAAFPLIEVLDSNGQVLPAGADEIAFTRYTLTLRDDLRYQPHPAFALNAQGEPLYLFESAAEGAAYRQLPDFPETDSRLVLASDYAYAIRRLADPEIGSPMLALMGQYIVGMQELTETLKSAPRQGWLDLAAYELRGVEVLDEHQLSITINGTYPQFVYWLAMHFFSPIPPEADRFYHNPGFLERNLTLDWWPVGSGPYMMTVNDPNSAIVLERNPNYREDYFPTEGAPGDRERGFLADAGERLPMIDKAVFTMEKGLLSLWTKFLQGYYDRSGETRGNTGGFFDQAFVVSPDGLEMSPEIADKGIAMTPDVKPGTYYYGFNMRDPVLGGYTEERRKLRRALQIAFNTEEYLNVFYKGNAIVGHMPIPPGIPGFVEGESGINPYTHEWIDGEARRRSTEEARQLLAEAGYPNGRDKETGEPLRIYMDVQSQAISKAQMTWIERNFDAIGVQVEFRASDWNRTREKYLTGNTQIFSLGWLADYPDPENFLFLLYGPESPLECDCDGANNANYNRPEYNALFRQVKVMPPGPERDAVVAQMVDLYREDAVWLYNFYPLDVYLNHAWVYNSKRHGISKGTLKYLRLDPSQREQSQRAWNQPEAWPMYAGAALFVGLLLPGVISYRRRLYATAKEG
ncbi:MAG: ABC transporter substrate-binding protein [Pseudomonadota bacterium]